MAGLDQRFRLLREARFRGRVLGCAVHSGYTETNPEAVVWLIGGISGDNRPGVLAHALGGEYHRDSAETVNSLQ